MSLIGSAKKWIMAHGGTKALTTLLPKMEADLARSTPELSDEMLQVLGGDMPAARLAPIKASVFVSETNPAVHAAVANGKDFTSRVTRANPPRTAPVIKTYSEKRLRGDEPRVPADATGIKETAGRVL